MGQHGFDTAVNTQTDPPGAAPTGAKSDVDDCLVTIITNLILVNTCVAF